MQELIESGQFLTLSRRNSALFERSHQFTLANGTLVDITAPGIISFSVQPTSKPNKRIVLSCGVHGNETAPIEICDDLVKGILTGNITLAHDVLFLFGNLPAMDIAERFVEENMNRLFSGAHSKGEGLVNAERVRAKQLEDAVASFCKRVLCSRRGHRNRRAASHTQRNRGDTRAGIPILSRHSIR